ncbi:MAG: arsenite S-adenosylmethyltransferase [candidate division Zixibacteria bacterium CG_4_9_14_3_um_filter_46_8]|nr:MAG: arsenite S-adenosylmethyltransferase [candidate division Zixibacteria bacterium CG_4_9_14_3_um_filter_46_8]
MPKDQDEIRKSVREGYAKIATGHSSCCAPSISCCGNTNYAQEAGLAIGYSEEELKSVPEGANLGLGCGNPVALVSLKLGEIVVDLGSGAGFDCFLAANEVGHSGHIIGVDMTPEMIDKARGNARKGNYRNVEFRLGEIEHLPVADNSADVVLSNCVINLSPDKLQVFKEAFRVLKPGGRMMVSDIVLLKDLPEKIKNSVSAYVGCLSGAMMKIAYLAAIAEAGFEDVRIASDTSIGVELMQIDPTGQAIQKELNMRPEEFAQAINHTVRSIKVNAIKPL